MDSKILLVVLNVFLLEVFDLGSAAKGKCVQTISNSSGQISLDGEFTETAEVAGNDDSKDSVANCQFRFTIPAGHLLLLNITQLDGDDTSGGGKHCTPRISIKDPGQTSSICARDIAGHLPLLLRSSSGPDFRVSFKWSDHQRANFEANYRLIQLQETLPSCVYTCNFQCLDSIGAVCGRSDICTGDDWRDICLVYPATQARRPLTRADAGSQAIDHLPEPARPQPDRFEVMSYILAESNYTTTTLQANSAGTMLLAGAANEPAEAEALGTDSLPVVVILVSALVALALMCTVLALTLRHAHKRACQQRQAAAAATTVTATGGQSPSPDHSPAGSAPATPDGRGSPGMVRGCSIRVESELMEQQRRNIMTRSPATQNYPATVRLPGEATPPYNSLMSLNLASDGARTTPPTHRRDNELCRQIVCAPPNVVVGQNSLCRHGDEGMAMPGQAREPSGSRHCPARPSESGSKGAAVLGSSPSADLTKPLLPLPLPLPSNPSLGDQASERFNPPGNGNGNGDGDGDIPAAV